MIEYGSKRSEPVGSGEDAKTPYSHTIDVMLKDTRYSGIGRSIKYCVFSQNKASVE